MQSSQLLALLHLTDSSFPTGAFSHSYGLETYTQQGIVHDASTLVEFLIGRLVDGMSRFDLILLREAMHTDETTLSLLDEQVSAMLTVAETREASVQVGKRFLKAALPLYGDARAQAYFSAIREKRVNGHFVLAFGVIAASLNLTAEEALTAYAHAFVMGQAAAAVKLVNMGQTRTQQVIRTMQPVINNTVQQSFNFSLDELHVFTPMLDIRAMQHEFLFRRLFIS
jgi:urease accessory protein